MPALTKHLRWASIEYLNRGRKSDADECIYQLLLPCPCCNNFDLAKVLWEETYQRAKDILRCEHWKEWIRKLPWNPSTELKKNRLNTRVIARSGSDASATHLPLLLYPLRRLLHHCRGAPVTSPSATHDAMHRSWQNTYYIYIYIHTQHIICIYIHVFSRP